MHPYIVFVFAHYYPEGGWKDVLCDKEGHVRSFEGIDEARRAAQEKAGGPWHNDVYQIVDLRTGTVVETDDESK